MIDNHFVKQHHLMHKTRNSCLRSKKRSMTIRQANTGKHECCNVTATKVLRHSYLPVFG